MQEQYEHSSVFLTVQFYDSKESKMTTIFYMRHRKTKQNKIQKQINNNLTTAAFNNLLFFCFSQHPRMKCHISAVYLEKPMNNEGPKKRDNNPSGLVLALCRVKNTSDFLLHYINPKYLVHGCSDFLPLSPPK